MHSFSATWGDPNVGYLHLPKVYSECPMLIILSVLVFDASFKDFFLIRVPVASLHCSSCVIMLLITAKLVFIWFDKKSLLQVLLRTVLIKRMFVSSHKLVGSKLLTSSLLAIWKRVTWFLLQTTKPWFQYDNNFKY